MQLKETNPHRKFKLSKLHQRLLTHWGRMTHICVNKLATIGSDNGLSPDRRQAIIWTNGGILLIRPLGKNFSEIFIGIHTFSFKKNHLKLSSEKYKPFCPGLNVLNLTLNLWHTSWIHIPSAINSLKNETKGYLPSSLRILLKSLFLENITIKTLYVLIFFSGNINIYLYFMSCLHIDMSQGVRILPRIRLGLAYFT